MQVISVMESLVPSPEYFKDLIKNGFSYGRTIPEKRVMTFKRDDIRDDKKPPMVDPII